MQRAPVVRGSSFLHLLVQIARKSLSSLSLRVKIRKQRVYLVGVPPASQITAARFRYTEPSRSREE